MAVAERRIPAPRPRSSPARCSPTSPRWPGCASAGPATTPWPTGSRSTTPPTPRSTPRTGSTPATGRCATCCSTPGSTAARPRAPPTRAWRCCSTAGSSDRTVVVRATGTALGRGHRARRHARRRARARAAPPIAPGGRSASQLIGPVVRRRAPTRHPTRSPRRLHRMTSGRPRIELRSSRCPWWPVSSRAFQDRGGRRRRRGRGGGRGRGVTRTPRQVVGAGVPHPPPPGVSTRSTSPRAQLDACTLSGRRRARASSPPGSSQFSPAAPGLAAGDAPGRLLRRSVTRDTVASASTSSSRTVPVATPVRAARHRCRAAASCGARARAARARAPRPACRACSSCWSARRSCRRPTGARPGRHRSSRSTPTARRRPARSRAARCSSCPGWRRRRARRQRPRERAEAHVGDPLAHLHVPRTDRDRRDARRPRCRAARPRCTGRMAPPLAGMVGSSDGAQRELDRAHGHRFDRMDVARTLRAGAGEVDDAARRRCAVTAHDDRHRRSAAPGAVPAESRTSSNAHGPVRSPNAATMRGAHAALAVVEQLGETARRRRSRARSTSSRRRAAPRPGSRRAARRGHRDVRPVCGTRRRTARRARRSRAKGRRRIPSSSMVVASGGIEPGAMPPTSAWCARFATHPTSRRPSAAKHGDTQRHVVEVRAAGERVVDDHLVTGPGAAARRDERRLPPRAEAGIEPRCTGMCSACTSSSPSAVNSAAEQSARSLMFGLDAGRRSTAPISSATLPRREARICRPAGSSTLDHPCPAGAGPAPPNRRGPTPCSPPPPTTAGPRTGRRGRVGGGSAVDGERPTAACTRTERDHLDRRVAAREPVAQLVRVVERLPRGLRPRAATVSSWLCPA